MIEYVDGGDLAIFNGYSFRRDKKTGYFLSAKLISGKRKRLHVYVWEFHNGEIPNGYHVHHIDGNKNNNEIENLQLLTATEHCKEHWKDCSEEKLEKLRKNLIENAIPKAKEWHKSEEGREWHSEHGKLAYANRQPTKYNCTFCGKEFETTRRFSEGKTHFCSNNCKSAYRRKMGYDDIKRSCAKCGGTFIVNKYSKRKYCDCCLRGKNRA